MFRMSNHLFDDTSSLLQPQHDLADEFNLHINVYEEEASVENIKNLRQTAHQSMQNTLNEMFALKNKIISVRYDKSLSHEQIKEQLKTLLYDLGKLDKELQQMLSFDTKQLEQDLQLDHISAQSFFPRSRHNSTISNASPEGLDSSRPRARSRSASPHTAYAQQDTDLPTPKSPSTSNLSNIPSNPSLGTPPTGSSAMHSWGNVLNVITTALKWKKNTLDKKYEIAEGEDILHSQAKVTKEEILKLRRLLYAIRDKKQPSLTERGIKKALEERLKELEEQFKEQMKDSI